MSTLVNESSISSAGDIYLVPVSRTSNQAAISSHYIWPASCDRSEGSPVLQWMQSVRARVEDLASCSEGWDGYHARPLQASSVHQLMRMLQHLGYFIRRAPSVALSADGGLICRWDSGDFTLQLDSPPVGEVDVYFLDANGHEHDLPISRATDLEKWLWQASADF